ncbi:MAG: hypothetical protein IPG55_02255 [Saprospiraceae bacterium]|nr:hypothetical protein [Candidatus Defluviibacterium haderslevense]MBK7244473.1 hypothetical protein [Candidatus Defluviibacterium haderslevense]
MCAISRKNLAISSLSSHGSSIPISDSVYVVYIMLRFSRRDSRLQFSVIKWSGTVSPFSMGTGGGVGDDVVLDLVVPD